MIPEQLAAEILEQSPMAEEQGRLTLRQLEIIYEKRWFHLLVPSSLGGAEMPLPQFAEFMERLAQIDGAFAWNVNLGAGANLFAGFMDQKLAKRLFQDPRMCIAGSGMLSGTAQLEAGRYRVSGSWKYASGAPHATFFSLNTQVEGPSGKKVMAFIVPKACVEIENTWNVLGLKATGSHDFTVSGCSVPKDHAFSLLGPSPHHRGVLYRFPFMALAEINMLVMLTGLSMRFAELSKAYLEQRGRQGAAGAAGRLESFSKVSAQLERGFYNARARVFDLLSVLWERESLHQPIREDDLRAFSAAAGLCAQRSREWVDALYPFLGMYVVFQSSPLNRVWRDFKTASQHALMVPLWSQFRAF